MGNRSWGVDAPTAGPEFGARPVDLAVNRAIGGSVNRPIGGSVGLRGGSGCWASLLGGPCRAANRATARSVGRANSFVRRPIDGHRSVGRSVAVGGGRSAGRDVLVGRVASVTRPAACLSVGRVFFFPRGDSNMSGRLRQSHNAEATHSCLQVGA